MRKKPKPASPARDNIDTIVRMEVQFLERRNFVERMGDAIGSFAGSFKFVVLHISVFGFWFLANMGTVHWIHAWDPYPFVLLNMAVSVEAVLLATFVLMKQNREGKRSEHREHLTLQIAMLTEQETTKVLQLVRHMCDHLGVCGGKDDSEAKVLAENTAVEDLVEQLKEKLPGE